MFVKMTHAANAFVGVLATASAGTPLDGAGSFLSCALSLAEVLKRARPSKDLSARVERDLEQRLAHVPASHQPLIIQMIEAAPMTPPQIIEQGRDPARIATVMLSGLRDPAHLAPAVQQSFRDVVQPALAHWLNDPAILAQLRPFFETEVLQTVQHIESLVQHLVKEGREEARRYHINEGLLIGLARNYAKDDVTDFDTAYRGLQAALQEYDKMRAANALPHNADAHLDAVLQRVQALNDAARFADARAALAQARAQQADRMAEAASGMQRLWDQTVSQARLENDPDLAAEALVERLKLDQPDDLFEAIYDLWKVWYFRHRDFGLLFDGQVAVALARLFLAHAKGMHQEGVAHNTLGGALQTLGERIGDEGLLHQAVDAYNAALLVYTQRGATLDLAMTLNNLGITLRILGGWAGDDGLLKQAVETHRAVLDLCREGKIPLDLAVVQNNYGNALQALGARTLDVAFMQHAVDAYKAALLMQTQAEKRLDWANTQNNLGAVLQTVGARTQDKYLLRQAIDAFSAALNVYTLTDTPTFWARTQNNLGNALCHLGELAQDITLLQQAVTAFTASLMVRSEGDSSLDWAMTQNNLGTALQALGVKNGKQELLKQAAEAYSAAQHVYLQTKAPMDAAETTENLARLDLAFHDLDPDPRHLASARERALAARTVYERIGAEWNVANVDRLLSDIAARSAP